MVHLRHSSKRHDGSLAGTAPEQNCSWERELPSQGRCAMKWRATLLHHWVCLGLLAALLPFSCAHQPQNFEAEIRVGWNAKGLLTVSCNIVGGDVDLKGYGVRSLSEEIEGRPYVGLSIQNGPDQITAKAAEDEGTLGRVYIMVNSPYPTKVTVDYPSGESDRGTFVVRSMPPGHHRVEIDRPPQ